MKKFPLFRLVTLATAVLLSAAPAEETNGIAAVVNGRPILRSEVEEVIKVQGMQLRATIGDKAELDRELGDLRKKALDTLVLAATSVFAGSANVPLKYVAAAGPPFRHHAGLVRCRRHAVAGG